MALKEGEFKVLPPKHASIDVGLEFLMPKRILEANITIKVPLMFFQ